MLKEYRITIDNFYNTLVDVANAEEGEIIVKENSADRMYSEGAVFFHHLRFFGFGELELIEGAKGKYEDSIRSFSPNKFGIEITNFAIRRGFVLLEQKRFKTAFGRNWN